MEVILEGSNDENISNGVWNQFLGKEKGSIMYLSQSDNVKSNTYMEAMHCEKK